MNVRALVVVGMTDEHRCGHCGSPDLTASRVGVLCVACVHWCAWFGGVPPATTWDDLASTFNGAKETA